MATVSKYVLQPWKQCLNKKLAGSGLICLVGSKMSRPGSSLDEKGVNQHGVPGGHLCALTRTHTAAAASPETRLLLSFKEDTQARKVYLAGRGECAHPRLFRMVLSVILFYFIYRKQEDSFTAFSSFLSIKRCFS